MKSDPSFYVSGVVCDILPKGMGMGHRQCLPFTFGHMPGPISIMGFAHASQHGLRTPREEIAFTARLKIQSQSQIFRYGRSIFCLHHRPNFSDTYLWFMPPLGVRSPCFSALSWQLIDQSKFQAATLPYYHARDVNRYSWIKVPIQLHYWCSLLCIVRCQLRQTNIVLPMRNSIKKSQNLKVIFFALSVPKKSVQVRMATNKKELLL